MTVACYLDPRPDVAELMRLFAQGCGGRLVEGVVPDAAATDHAVAAKGSGLFLVPTFRRQRLPFWYLDTAYIQLRGTRYYRIERGTYWPPTDMGSYSLDRALSMGVRPQPWRKTGSHVVLCLPGPMAGSDFGVDMKAWWEVIKRRLESATDRPIHIRHKKERETRPLAADLEGAWCLVTHSSTAAVEAVIAGVPVFVEPTCAAAPVGRTDLDIENPVMPDREPWLAALAHRQFSREELRSGFAWAHVNATQ